MRDPSLLCSQVHRALVRWSGQDRGNVLCGADRSASVELLALGHGGLLAHHRFSPPDERWDLRDDGSLQRSGEIFPRQEWTYSGFTLLPGYSHGGDAPAALDSLLVFDPRRSLWVLTRESAGLLNPEYSGTWPVLPGAAEPWDLQKPAGRELVGLAHDLVLDRSLGDGRTRFWQLGLGADRVRTIAPLSQLQGAAREEFRRGHRLVPLGPGRLLEWLPLGCSDAGSPASADCSRFNVWSYDATTTPTGDPSLPVDPFATAPTSSGSWTDVGEDQEVLADEEHVFVWSRPTGQIRIYRQDAHAADPLTPALLVASPQVIPALANPRWRPPTRAAALEHVLLVLQDGQSFDGIFGRHCQGAPGPGGAPPACEEGPGCCEGLPAEAFATCQSPDPAARREHVPNATAICMRAKMNDGAMDGFAVAHGAGCGDPGDVACADTGSGAGALAKYHALATSGALADRFFQTYAYVQGDGDPAGQGHMVSVTDPTTQNLVYLTAARFGSPFSFMETPQLEQDLARMEVDWAIYAGAKSRALLRVFDLPLCHDPSFFPFRALEAGELEADLRNGRLPSVAVVLPDGDDPGRSEARGNALARPVDFVTNLVESVMQSPRYGSNTLVLFTYLTAGGYYDHVRPPAPPPPSVDATDGDARTIFYGPRVPLVALGPFARPHHVSHVPLEISSVTSFIEWNWLSGRSIKDDRAFADPRSYRDTWVNGIGSLLDPSLAVPSGRP